MHNGSWVTFCVGHWVMVTASDPLPTLHTIAAIDPIYCISTSIKECIFIPFIHLFIIQGRT